MEEQRNGTYYYFDCLDGGLSAKYWTAAELAAAMHKSDPLTEKQIRAMAINYESLLMRYEYNNGTMTAEKKLYDPFDIFEQ